MTDSAYDERMLPCPACGALSAEDQHLCKWCENHLLVSRCAGCNATHFVGASTCAGCARPLRPARPAVERAHAACPRCTHPLVEVALEELTINECVHCAGVWIDRAELRAVLDPKRRASIAAIARPDPPPIDTHEVRDLECPVCTEPMNRRYVGRPSEILVDVCAKHGTWFDAGELARALELLGHGGPASEAAAKVAADLHPDSMTSGRSSARLSERRSSTHAASGGMAARVLDSLLFELVRLFDWP